MHWCITWNIWWFCFRWNAFSYTFSRRSSGRHGLWIRLNCLDSNECFSNHVMKTKILQLLHQYTMCHRTISYWGNFRLERLYVHSPWKLLSTALTFNSDPSSASMKLRMYQVLFFLPIQDFFLKFWNLHYFHLLGRCIYYFFKELFRLLNCFPFFADFVFFLALVDDTAWKISIK